MNIWRYIFVLLGFLGITLALPAPKFDRKKCLKRNGLFEKPGSLCRSYYKCSNWIPVEDTCPIGQHFIPRWQRCDWSELHPCFEKPQHEVCLRPNGKFLKPGTQCKIFYSCCNGRPKEEKCPGDSLFNPDSEKCEWPELYICVEGISSTSTARFTPTVAPSSPEGTSTFDDMSSTSPSMFEPSTTSNIPKDSSTTEEVSSTSSPTFTLPTTLSTLENTPTVVGTQTAKDATSTKEILLVTSTVSALNSKAYTTTEDIPMKTEPNVDASSLKISSSDFSLTSSYEITTEYKVSTTTEGPTETKNEISESTSVRSTDKTVLTPSQFTEEVSLSSAFYTSSPGTPNIVCPKRSGYFPHPTDKHKFIGCVDWIPSIMSCPSDLVYDHNKRACVYDKS